MWYLFLRTVETDIRTGEYRVDIVGPFDSPKRVNEWIERTGTDRSSVYRVLAIARWDATVQNPGTMDRNHYIIH